MDFQSQSSCIANSSAEIKPGSDLVDKDCPLLIITIIPDELNPTTRFAVILSICHTIVDGFNYYQILSMMSENSKIIKLNPTRKHQIVEDVKTVTGKLEHKYIFSFSFICNIVNKMIWPSKQYISNYEIDLEKVTSLKDQ